VACKYERAQKYLEMYHESEIRKGLTTKFEKIVKKKQYH
jgi:hypothetical protein